ncbi:MAG: tape measure protein [Pseudomonadota bacterium]
MATTANLKAIISVVDRVTAPMKGINRALRSPIKAVQDVASATRNLGGSMGGVIGPAAGIAGVLGGGGAAFGIGKLLEVGSQFEKFQNILEVVEGSSEKARASMGWVREFAKTTPYQLAEVTDAFVRLKAYGLDPTNGLMKAAGDAASAMGKPLEQAVEAAADAVRGQNERLLELGIVGEKVGDTMVYRWDKNGKAMVTHAQNNSAAIQKAIIGIWGSKFDGAMEKQSESFEGILSNIADSVTDFFKTVDDQGIFNAAKDELRGIQGLIAGWEADGTLKAVAVAISGALTGALAGLKSTLVSIDWKAAWAGVQRFAGAVMAGIEAIGGWGNALIILAVILNAQTIVAVMQMVGVVGRLAVSLARVAAMMVVQAFTLIPAYNLAIASGIGPLGSMRIALLALGGGMMKAVAATWAWTAALLANPVTWIVLGVVALIAAMVGLAAGIAWAVTHWDEFKAKVGEVKDAIMGGFGAALDWAGEKLQAFVGWAMGIWEDIKGIFTGAGPTGGKSWKPDIRFGIADKPKMQAAVAAASTNVPAAAVVAANTNIPAPANSNVLADPVPAQSAPSPAIAAAAGRMQLVGQVDVNFQNAPPGMRVSGGQTNQPGLVLNPNVGYRSMSVVG